MEEFAVLFVSVLAATLRVAATLVFCALAGMFSERSGIIDIGLEGKMLAASFAAACVAMVTGSAWAALLGAIIVSCGFALVHGLACITYRGNQVVSGVAIRRVADRIETVWSQKSSMAQLASARTARRSSIR